VYFSLRFRGPDRKACGFQHSPGGLGCFRDTFAVECLLAGVPLERVSVLLGHSSAKVTERHYVPWVQKRQQQLEADLRSIWANDQTGTN
jgi:integrase